MVFVVTCFSGQELDDISKASCHMYNPKTGKDYARFSMSGNKSLDKQTCLIVGSLFRPTETSNDWCLRIIAWPNKARMPQDTVATLGQILKVKPPTIISPPAHETISNEMPAESEAPSSDVVISMSGGN